MIAFDPGEGWVEFVVPVTAQELLWTGIEGDREGVPEGTRPRDELEDWLSGRPVRRLGAATDADQELRDELVRVRRPKDDIELERMRIAAEATRAGFAELVSLIEPGRTERELQVATRGGISALRAATSLALRVHRRGRRPQTPSCTSRRQRANYAPGSCCSWTPAPSTAAMRAT